MSQPQAANGVPDTSMPVPPLDQDQQEVSRVLRGLRHDPNFMGCFSLGEDGIMRSLTADRDVVDAAAFSPKLIRAFLGRMPFEQKLEDLYRGVDGTHVPREQWFYPDKSILPAPMTQEVKERTLKKIEENRELFDKKREQMESGEEFKEACPVVVRSTYNLDPKPSRDG